MKTYAIPPLEMTLLLKPEEPAGESPYEIDLSRVFGQVLQHANEFVPSEAGTIYLRDATSGSEVELVAAAAFGPEAEQLPGERQPLDDGIAGWVFRHGRAFVGASPSSELLRGEDESWGAGTVVALPLRVGDEVVGVLELLKDRSGKAFDDRELELLELYAHTISASIAHAVEAQRSKEMARRDELTRLFNDRYLHHALNALLDDALDRGSDCGLLFIDLDHFKNVNDNHGHLIGSRVLQEVGDILRQVLPGPAVPARYGGDEFLVILPGATRPELYWTAETIRKTLETHVFLEHPDPRDPLNYPGLAIAGVTCCVGYAGLRDDVLRLFRDGEIDSLAAKNELIRLADARMYRAKDLGRNRTVGSDGETAETVQAL